MTINDPTRKTAALLVWLCLGSSLVAQQTVFRQSATIVKLDVQVFDAQGQLVEDVRPEEFSVREDGAVQAVSLFVPPEVRVNTNLGSNRAVPSSTNEADTLLIVLGRGRLEVPARGLTALEPLLRDRISRGARIGFVAYNRIVGPTKDLGQLQQFVVRYRERHERIDDAINNWFWGLAGFYSDGQTPRWLDDLVDQVFAQPGLPASRVFPRIDAPELPEFDQIRTAMENYARQARGRGPTGIKADQDLAKLLTAVEALRHEDGRKAMIFVTDQPPMSIRVEPMEFVSRLAADAGIRVSTIQTGGSPGDGWVRDDRGTVRFSGRSFEELFALEETRSLAKMTGGQFSAYQMASKAVEKILAIDDRYYVLGYIPSDSSAKPDGRFHNITITVNRPGVTVSYRHGYYRLPLMSSEEMRAEMGRQRIAAAYRDPHDLPDVAFNLRLTTSATGTTVTIDIDPKTVSFRPEASSKVASLEVGVAAVESGRVVTHTQAALDSTPKDNRTTSSRIAYTAKLSGIVKRGTRIKVAVYDVTEDKIGSRWKEIR